RERMPGCLLFVRRRCKRARSSAFCSARPNFRDNLRRLIQDELKMLLANKALGVEFVEVLGSRRPRGKPTVGRYNLQTADRSLVAWRDGQLLNDRLAGEIGGGDVFG